MSFSSFPIPSAELSTVAADARTAIGAMQNTNAAVNTAIATDATETRNTLKSPKVGIPGGASFGGKFLAGDVQTTPQVRGLYMGDSVCYPPDTQLRGVLGNGGYINDATGDGAFIAGAATRETSATFSKSFNGTYVNLSTGTCLFGEPGTQSSGTSMPPILGCEVWVWYWSETGGGTFTVESDLNLGGSYTTLKSGTLSGGGLNGQACTVITNGTINASGVVDATDGGAGGALRYLRFTLPNPQFVRVRCNGSGSAGSAKIIAAGAIEVPNQAIRQPGYIGLNMAMFGTNPTQWDDMTDASLSTLLSVWNPDFLYVRGFEQLTEWQNEWTALAARIKAIRPHIHFIIVGMHPSNDTYGNTNVLTTTDKYQQQWCDANDATFIPIRNRMGDIGWSVKNDYAVGGTRSITSGVNATGVITTSVAHNGAAGYWLKFTALTGGSGLVLNRPYRILAAPTSTTFTLADTNGTTPIALGSDISAGSVVVYTDSSGTLPHLSLTGQSFVANCVMEDMAQAVIPRIILNGITKNSNWQREPVDPQNLQPFFGDKYWRFAGPTTKRRAIQIGRLDGSGTASGYYASLEIGASLINNVNEAAYISGPSGTGFGMAWDSNYAILGSNPRGIGRNLNTGSDMLEIYNSNNGLTSLAIGTAGTTTSHQPLTVWRNGTTTSSKGTEVARVDATGQAKFVIRTFADDAAADADATLLSGMLYRTTAGGRAVFQKP